MLWQRLSDRGRRSRGRLVLVAAAIVVLGLLGRMLPGEVGNLVGGALYTALLYCIVALFAPTVRPVGASVAAYGFSALAELAQLTMLPSQLAAAFPPAALVFGTTFAWLDFMGYAIGAASALVVDAAGPGRRR